MSSALVEVLGRLLIAMAGVLMLFLPCGGYFGEVNASASIPCFSMR